MTPATVYESAEEAIKDLKLDRRHKWKVVGGILCYPFKYTTPCTGCSCDCSSGYGCNHGNAGCRECGYTGRRRDVAPIPALDKNDYPVIIKPKK